MSYQASSPMSEVQIVRVTDAHRSWELEDIIKSLEAQVESLELELSYKNYQMEERQQELRYTNQELCAASNLEKLTFAQAEELARNFFVTEKPIKDALVELLTAIYNVRGRCRNSVED